MDKLNSTSKCLAIAERTPDVKGDVPNWQLMVMLHYEYARCSTKMLQAVRAITQTVQKKSNQPLSGFARTRFARFLAHNFPEFPNTPWENIAEDAREARLSSIGINEDNGLYPSPPPAWEFWEFGDQEAQSFELLDIDRESYGIFKVDFSQKDQAIKKHFAKWLVQRRSQLLMKYDSTGQLAAGIKRNRNDCFRGYPRQKRPKGAVAPPKKYRTALTALGNLRSFIHADRDIRRANDIQEKDLSSWSKYEFYAGTMMRSIQSSWQSSGFIIDVFDRKNLLGQVGFFNMVAPPEKLDAPRAGKLESIQNFLNENFTLVNLVYQ